MSAIKNYIEEMDLQTAFDYMMMHGVSKELIYILIKEKNPKFLYLAARLLNGVDVDLLYYAILETGDINYITKFCRDIYGADETVDTIKSFTIPEKIHYIKEIYGFDFTLEDDVVKLNKLPKNPNLYDLCVSINMLKNVDISDEIIEKIPYLENLVNLILFGKTKEEKLAEFINELKKYDIEGMYTEQLKNSLNDIVRYKSKIDETPKEYKYKKDNLLPFKTDKK